MSKLAQLRERLAQIRDLNAAAAVLEWDQETYMPDGAAAARAHQVATLRRLAHEQLTADATGILLQAAAAEVHGQHPHHPDAALVRVAQRDFDKECRIPPTLVADMAQAVSLGKQAWKEARETDTYATFAPHLERLVTLNYEKARAYGYADRPYDALLDLYEPGMTTAEVERIFWDLRKQLVPIVRAIAAHAAPDDGILRRPFPEQAQWDFGVGVIRDIGYDFSRGRQDRSTHPFTTSFSITDVRITTRLDVHFFNPAFFGTLHEAGHGLYEQGIDPSLDRTPLAEGTSLGIHESQSRLWENLVGRSRPFWSHYYPRLQQAFPDALGGVTADAFYRAINRVEPSPIRVEADEVTYNLHIMLRFEIENALLEGRVRIDEVPDLWDDKMHEYFGLRPQNDTEGVLQDIHWSLGALGYFPTYALGNLMSTQLFAQAAQDLGDLEGQIAQGQFAPLLGWLREHVHRHGRIKTATEILHDATGQGLSATSWLQYIQSKYSRLYGF